MKAGTRVRFTKLDQFNEGLVDVGHWTEGVLLTDVVVGDSIRMERDVRKGFASNENAVMRLPGYFNTSTVQKIEGDENIKKIYTRNSIWQMEIL